MPLYFCYTTYNILLNANELPLGNVQITDTNTHEKWVYRIKMSNCLSTRGQQNAMSVTPTGAKGWIFNGIIQNQALLVTIILN